MLPEKKCFKCNVVKPLNEFYKHSKMADGHLNKCIACAKNDVGAHRLKNLDRIRAYDRDRGKKPQRRAAAAKVSAEWRQADKRRMKCHNAVTRARKKGLLIQQPCIRCGDHQSLAHHEDYSKPLDVMWLCQPCHKVRHKELLLERESA